MRHQMRHGPGRVRGTLRRVAEQFEKTKRRRDDAIVRASEAGMPHRRVAEAVGLSRSRVQRSLTSGSDPGDGDRRQLH
jgi:hypothetical protein